MLSAYTSFAIVWHWTPRQVDELELAEFWHFLVEFEKMGKKENKPKFDVKNPRYRKEAWLEDT